MPPMLDNCDAEAQSVSEDEESSSTQLPSVGSAQHGSGSCQPCAWFWKPQGCLNGPACLRCHLCPAGEIKRRKGELKQKKAQAAEGSAEQSTASPRGATVPPPSPPSAAPCLKLTEEGLPPAPSWTASDPALPSVGSRLHGSGQCKPCAWFWKAEGCRNESACGHCHLCPMGEAKARKQAKLAIIRAKASQTGQTEIGSLTPEETKREQVFQAALGTSEVRPIAVLAPPTLLFNMCEVTPHLGHPQAQPLQPVPLFPQQPVQPAQVHSINSIPQIHPIQQVQQIQQVRPVQAVPSAQHSQSCHTAWKWCPTGQVCQGCAYCSQAPPLQPGQPAQPQRPVLLGNPLSAFQSAQSVGKLCSRCGSEGCKCFPYEAGERRLVPQEVSFPGILPSVPLYHQPVHPPTQVVPPPLPSVGSALHADGKCSPCAWFWKPQGCRHGANCGRCHLCPAGEIKQRKKSKATAKEVVKDPLPGTTLGMIFGPLSQRFWNWSAQSQELAQSSVDFGLGAATAPMARAKAGQVSNS